MKKQQKLDVLIEGVEALRAELGDTVQAQTIMSLLHIARQGEVSIQGLGKLLGLTTASASRNAAFLGRYWKHGREGLGLVEMREDPADRRHKTVVLSAKGKRFVEKLTGG